MHFLQDVWNGGKPSLSYRGSVCPPPTTRSLGLFRDSGCKDANVLGFLLLPFVIHHLFPVHHIIYPTISTELYYPFSIRFSLNLA